MSHTTTILYMVYLVTNLVNGKQYVGITNDLHTRWRAHRKATRDGLGLAIRKYGVENFTVEVIAKTPSRKRVLELEVEFIKARGTLSPKGYNLTTGGEAGRVVTEESRRKQSLSKMGKPSPRKGAVLTEETKQLISLSKRGVSTATEYSKAKWSRDRKGNTYARARGVKQIDLKGNLVAEYRSVKSASEITGIHRTAINRTCLGGTKTAGGYVWLTVA